MNQKYFNDVTLASALVSWQTVAFDRYVWKVRCDQLTGETTISFNVGGKSFIRIKQIVDNTNDPHSILQELFRKNPDFFHDCYAHINKRGRRSLNEDKTDSILISYTNFSLLDADYYHRNTLFQSRVQSVVFRYEYLWRNHSIKYFLNIEPNQIQAYEEGVAIQSGLWPACHEPDFSVEVIEASCRKELNKLLKQSKFSVEI